MTSLLSLLNSSGLVRKQGKDLLSQPSESPPTLHVPNTKPVSWLTFQTFLTCKELSIIKPPEDSYRSVADRIGNGDPHLNNLHELLLTGDVLEAPSFENAVLDELLQSYKLFYEENGGRVPLGNVVHLLEHTMNRNLCSFLLDMLIFATSERTILQAVKEGHLNKTVKYWIDQRAFVTRDHVRVPSWDHPERFQQAPLENCFFF